MSVNEKTLLRVTQNPKSDGVFYVWIGSDSFEVEINDSINIGDDPSETEAALIKTIIQFFIDKRGY